jgi:hypothetical protein
MRVDKTLFIYASILYGLDLWDIPVAVLLLSPPGAYLSLFVAYSYTSHIL